MGYNIRYPRPSYDSYGKDELKANTLINCAKGSIGAQCKGEAIGTVCITKNGILCSGVGGIGISCDSKQTGAVCTNGMTSFSCENSAQSTPDADNKEPKETSTTKK